MSQCCLTMRETRCAEATERAERAEAELAKMKAAAKAGGTAKTHEQVADSHAHHAGAEKAGDCG